VVVGSSLGGVETLRLVLGELRTEIDVPIVVAHHLGPSASLLEKVLGRVSRLPVRWAVVGGRVEPDSVHLCPPRTVVRWEPDGTFTVRQHDGRSSLGILDELSPPRPPHSVVRAGLVDLVLPLPEIPELLDRVIGRRESLPLPEVLAAEAVRARRPRAADEDPHGPSAPGRHR
jgi:chemotaxis response regulator CheB